MLRFVFCIVFSNLTLSITAQDVSDTLSLNYDLRTYADSSIMANGISSNSDNGFVASKNNIFSDSAGASAGDFPTLVSGASQSTADSTYLEDQFYIGLSYNFLLNI